jgi:hypothetical protein
MVAVRHAKVGLRPIGLLNSRTPLRQRTILCVVGALTTILVLKWSRKLRLKLKDALFFVIDSLLEVITKHPFSCLQFILTVEDLITVNRYAEMDTQSKTVLRICYEGPGWGMPVNLI